ncbi:zinc ribbon domain-containing protein [Pseudomonas sp. MH9.3]|uniref:zinc ribbon domain-containing protein n=1 Tax=Pseudomonas sp. MH9.3 TaxID=3048630 RepID=UPI002AC9BD1F|nr:zinc ribbon domain-containing protein [Pseudomonas sp. MH9.3]MEB0106634.1 zinc ribbon domain-containing protein [Pseudomonas sp. MH9.3]WPX81273.1 zinc ribbon domain-containing protein [Pseudomonas sp. MH9.3]WQG57041.1 zinc ribbon domain-containing protein [Pseudomonas sp. RTB3]
MALKSCKSCKHEVDSTAKVCPGCGVKNPGVTVGQQVFGFVILLVIIVVTVSMCSGGSKEEHVQKVAQKASSDAAVPSAYSITKDDFREGRPRKVEVTLPKRLSDTELAEVSKAIRADTKFNAEKTFIGFRVTGQTDKAYWASASFDPDYRSSLIGLGAKDYQALAALDLKAYPNRIGSWLRDGALGHVMVLFKLNDKYVIDSIFPSGGKNTDFYVGKKLPDGGLRLDDPETSFNEYYVVDANGNLQGWGENGVYMTLPPFKPAQ